MNKSKLLPVILLVCMVSVSCGKSGPRQAPFPVLDPQAPFAFKGSVAKARGAVSEEDEEIAKMLREIESDVPSTAAGVAGQQTVLLAGRFASEIPLHFDEWRWATDGDVTLVAHFSEGRVDGVIYAESFGPLTKISPVEETRRFISTVDPSLNGPLALLNSAFSLAARGVSALGGSDSDSGREDAEFDDSDGPSDQEIEDIAAALMAAITRTGGQGLGYRSTQRTFSGWKWIGRSEMGLSFRLARTTGIWGPQGGGNLTAISGAVKSLDFLTPVFNFFGVDASSSSHDSALGMSKGEVPAWMIFGNVVLEDDIGIHIAFLCAREPECSVTANFVNFIENMRLPTRAVANAAHGSGAATSLEELSRAVRLRIAPNSIMMDLGKLADFIREGIKIAD